MRVFSSVTASFAQIGARQFHQHILDLTAGSAFHRANLTVFDDYAPLECWLACDQSSGFALTRDHELVNVFSQRAGYGALAISHATGLRDYLHLNCYAGPLEQIYARQGFREVRREKNWQLHGPDVVYMQYGKASRHDPHTSAHPSFVPAYSR